MCTFLCFAISSDGKPSRAISAFARFGIALRQLPAHARANDYPFDPITFVTTGHCDCGTALGAGETQDPEALSELEQTRAALTEAAKKSEASYVAVYRTWGETWERRDGQTLRVEMLDDPVKFGIRTLANLPENVVLVIPNWVAAGSG